jgi:hypothetical protein
MVVERDKTMNDVKRPRSKANAGNYEVGYGRPPVHRRFAPGQCGNPKGRPKGVRNFATDVKDVLKAQVKVTAMASRARYPPRRPRFCV